MVDEQPNKKSNPENKNFAETFKVTFEAPIINLYQLQKDEFMLTKGQIMSGQSKTDIRQQQEKTQLPPIGQKLKQIWLKVLGQNVESFLITNEKTQTAETGLYQLKISRAGVTLIEKKGQKTTTSVLNFNLNTFSINGQEQMPEIIQLFAKRIETINKDLEKNKAKAYSKAFETESKE